MKRLISPSPEASSNLQQPRGAITSTSSSTAQRRKSSTTANATQFLNQ